MISYIMCALRFEGGEISRIISTDEVLKKDLALIKENHKNNISLVA